MNSKIFFSVILSAFMLFIFTSCQNRNQANNPGNDMNQNDNNLHENNPNANLNQPVVIWDFNKNYTYDQKDQLKDDFNNAMDQLDDRMGKFEDKVDSASKVTQDWYNDRIKQFKEKKESLNDEIDKIDDTKRADWDKFQANLKTGWIELQNSWNDIREHVASSNKY